MGPLEKGKEQQASLQLIKEFLQGPKTEDIAERLFDKLSVRKLGELFISEIQKQSGENTQLLAEALKQLLQFSKTLQELETAEGLYLLKEGISSSESLIKEVCCIAVQKLVSWKAAIVETLVEQGVLQLLLLYWRMMNVVVFTQAKNALLCLASVSGDMVREPIWIELERYGKGIGVANSTVQIRAIQMLLELSEVEHNNNYLSLACSILVDRLKNSTDLLFQLNIIELLASVGTMTDGCTYLENSGAAAMLLDFLSPVADESKILQQQLLQSATLRCIGRIGYAGHKEQLSFIEPFLPLVAELNAETDDVDRMEAVLYAIVSIANSPECFQLLWSRQGTQFFICVLSKLDMAEEKIRTACLYCLAAFFTNANEETSKRIYELYPKQSLMETLVIMAHQPFLSQAIALFSVFQALAEKEWGLRRLASTPGIVDIIVNSDVESKPLLDAKCLNAVQQKLANSLVQQESVANILFGDARFQKLINFANMYSSSGGQYRRRDPQVDIATMRQ
eukprot:jgi/Galph1/4899/GphlegSOOS_G3586.1